MKERIHVALIGNPNTGKTSLFNQLTGLNQKVGNYPGVTVDKKEGVCKLPNDKTATITDLPGTYSINPTSADESIVLTSLINEEKPDVVLVHGDTTTTFAAGLASFYQQIKVGHEIGRASCRERC